MHGSYRVLAFVGGAPQIGKVRSGTVSRAKARRREYVVMMLHRVLLLGSGAFCDCYGQDGGCPLGGSVCDRLEKCANTLVCSP